MNDNRDTIKMIIPVVFTIVKLRNYIVFLNNGQLINNLVHHDITVLLLILQSPI